MQTMLTDQDVQDAYFAYRTQQLAQAEETTPAAIIRELANSQREINDNLAQLARGEKLLKGYMVLMSDRSTAGGLFDPETAERIVSPILQASAGHIGTSEAWRAIGLAQR